MENVVNIKYRRNWIISACAFRVNSRALYAYIRECAYNAVISSPTQQPDVSVMRADSQAGYKASKQGKQATQTGYISYYYVTVHFTVHLHHLNSYYKNIHID